MRVLITGSRGFIGRNLALALRRAGVEVAEIVRESPPAEAAEALRDCRVIFHLAGVNRPSHDEEFVEGNVRSLEAVLHALDDACATRSVPLPLIVLASSAQATENNPYGRSKLAAEQALEAFVSHRGSSAVIYRLPGVFGKWCRPNYNSVVATYCHNLTRDLPIVINDPARTLQLVHVDDVVAAFRKHLDEDPQQGLRRATVEPAFQITLGDLAARLQALRQSRETLLVPDTTDPLNRRLLGTYTSYMPVEGLRYPLQQRTDARGVLAELLKSPAFGQMFVSRTHPGVTRGNHYHDLKVEKFCVLEGDAVVRFRPVLGTAVTEHPVSGRDFAVVDIPPGMTHSIENVGTTEMVVLFWASEIFDPERPDTHGAEVNRA
jgi:UDP-2-acetamido-2,6-beta-L-arabino-hexul-4-ose reductase